MTNKDRYLFNGDMKTLPCFALFKLHLLQCLLALHPCISVDANANERHKSASGLRKNTKTEFSSFSYERVHRASLHKGIINSELGDECTLDRMKTTKNMWTSAECVQRRQQCNQQQSTCILIYFFHFFFPDVRMHALCQTNAKAEKKDETTKTIKRSPFCSCERE